MTSETLLNVRVPKRTSVNGHQDPLGLVFNRPAILKRSNSLQNRAGNSTDALGSDKPSTALSRRRSKILARQKSYQVEQQNEYNSPSNYVATAADIDRSRAHTCHDSAPMTRKVYQTPVRSYNDDPNTNVTYDGDFEYVEHHSHPQRRNTTSAPKVPLSSIQSQRSVDSVNGKPRAIPKRTQPVFTKTNCHAKIEFASSQVLCHKEDAHGYFSNFQIVADGCGGTVQSSAPLSKKLVSEGKKELAGLMNFHVDTFLDAIERFTARAINSIVSNDDPFSTQGSSSMASTLSIAYIDRRTKCLYSYTLGDSKTIVVRNKRVVFESSSVILGFNCPAYVSTNPQKDKSKWGQVEAFDLENNDYVLTFSDGITDNLFVEELTSIVSRAKNFVLQAVADGVTRGALNRIRSDDPYIPPLAVSAANVCYANLKQEFKRKGKSPELMKKLKYVKSLVTENEALGFSVLDQTFALERNEMAHYSMEDLIAFANLVEGKRDDITCCVAKITFALKV